MLSLSFSSFTSKSGFKILHQLEMNRTKMQSKVNKMQQTKTKYIFLEIGNNVYKILSFCVC
jgi:hypothetical protein